MPGSRRSADGPPRGSKRNPVRAAGALCWRRTTESAELEVLLVHSARWDEWSWPKGKLEPDESAPEAAVREVGEETGARIVLGRPLPSTAYEMPDGRHKVVQYWSGQPLGFGPMTAEPGEIAGRAWLSAGAARKRLSHRADREPLDELLKRDRHGLLETSPLLVVRHAKAVSRSAWDGTEATRPLTKAGLRQATRLSRLLECWRPEMLISSPWSRCVGTLAPFEQISGLTIELAAELTETSNEQHPWRTEGFLQTLLADPHRMVACTHRPVLATVRDLVAQVADSAARQQLPLKEPWLAPAQTLVIHRHESSVLSVELH